MSVVNVEDLVRGTGIAYAKPHYRSILSVDCSDLRQRLATVDVRHVL